MPMMSKIMIWMVMMEWTNDGHVVHCHSCHYHDLHDNDHFAERALHPHPRHVQMLTCTRHFLSG